MNTAARVAMLCVCTVVIVGIAGCVTEGGGMAQSSQNRLSTTPRVFFPMVSGQDRVANVANSGRFAEKVHTLLASQLEALGCVVTRQDTVMNNEPTERAIVAMGKLYQVDRVLVAEILSGSEEYPQGSYVQGSDRISFQVSLRVRLLSTADGQTVWDNTLNESYVGMFANQMFGRKADERVRDKCIEIIVNDQTFVSALELATTTP